MVIILARDGRYLELRGGNDWGYTDYVEVATQFACRKQALAAAKRCGIRSGTLRYL